MQLQPLIGQDRIQELTLNHAVNAVLLPSPEGKKIVMKVICKKRGEDLEGYLAMAYKPEARTFASPESAWNLSLKLGIKNLSIDNEKFAGVAA